MSFPPVYDDYVAYNYENAIVAFHDNGFACDDMSDFTPHFLVKPNLLELIRKLKIDIFISNSKIIISMNEFHESIINNSIFIYIRKF